MLTWILCIHFINNMSVLDWLNTQKTKAVNSMSKTEIDKIYDMKSIN